MPINYLLQKSLTVVTFLLCISRFSDTARNEECDTKNDDINHQTWVTGNHMILHEIVKIDSFSKVCLFIFRLETNDYILILYGFEYPREKS